MAENMVLIMREGSEGVVAGTGTNRVSSTRKLATTSGGGCKIVSAKKIPASSRRVPITAPFATTSLSVSAW